MSEFDSRKPTPRRRKPRRPKWVTNKFTYTIWRNWPLIRLPICITQLGMHPVHFGVMLIFNLAIGLCTPPVGSALFVGCAIGKTKIEKTSKNMLPLYAVMVGMLLAITYIPAISMTVPNLMK